MQLDIHNINGSKTGKTVNLPESIFGVEPNDHAIYLDVKQYLAHQRQGTHATLERSQVSGSTKKLGRQKGGGGARRGSIKSHVMIGGARAFGPRPHEYTFKLNKKVKALARLSALSYKAKENKIIVLEDLNLDKPKTKEYLNMLKALKADNNKTLHILDNYNKNVYLSGRNLPKAAVTTIHELNTYSILKSQTLLLAESTIKALEKQFEGK